MTNTMSHIPLYKELEEEQVGREFIEKKEGLLNLYIYTFNTEMFSLYIY